MAVAGVDEQPVDALGGQRDLGIPARVAAFGDVAGGRLHADAVPGDDEQPAQDEGEAGRLRTGEMEAGHVGPVKGAGLERRQEDQQGKRHHGDHAEEGSEPGPETDPQVAGYEQDHEPDHGDGQHPDALRRAEAAERVHHPAQGHVEQLGDVGGGQDHVDRCHREPPQPVTPAGYPPDVTCDGLAQRLEALVGVGRRASGAMRVHRGQLAHAQAHDHRDHLDADDGRNGRCPHGLHREGHDASDQDDSGQPDHEGTPPVGASVQRCGHSVGRPSGDVHGAHGVVSLQQVQGRDWRSRSAVVRADRPTPSLREGRRSRSLSRWCRTENTARCRHC